MVVGGRGVADSVVVGSTLVVGLVVSGVVGNSGDRYRKINT